MARFLIVLLLLLSYRTYAAPVSGGGGVGNPAGLRVQQGGVLKGDTGVLDLPPADYTCTPFPVMTCALNISVPHIGSCVGEPADWCTDVYLSSVIVHNFAVTQTTLGAEVFRVESATSGSPVPNLKFYQTRAVATANTTTNIDFNLTTAACTSGTVCSVTTSTVCHCTSGCAANQGGANITSWVVKNNGGTITQIGTTTSGNELATTVDASTPSISSIVVSIFSTTTLRVAVAVPAGFTNTCHINYTVQTVGT